MNLQLWESFHPQVPRFHFKAPMFWFCCFAQTLAVLFHLFPQLMLMDFLSLTPSLLSDLSSQSHTSRMLKVAVQLQIWRSGVQWEILVNVMRKWMKFSARDRFTRLKTVHGILSFKTFAWRANMVWSVVGHLSCQSHPLPVLAMLIDETEQTLSGS